LIAFPGQKRAIDEKTAFSTKNLRADFSNSEKLFSGSACAGPTGNRNAMHFKKISGLCKVFRSQPVLFSADRSFLIVFVLN
jgi:hypothetical protein